MKNIKSIVIGFLLATCMFLLMGYTSQPSCSCDEDKIISRILFCIDGATISDGRISTYCNR